ncbi:MAG: acyl carrier protein [Actinomycetales bacterium]|jgi:Phosphopantetheine attachment site.|nr:acyl carrier protein [Actinomycetales bacterium]
MTDDELRNVLITQLRRIAPEVEEAELRDTVPLRTQVDLDSLDWLTFLIGVHDALGVDIPEADYAALVTLADLHAYVRARL